MNRLLKAMVFISAMGLSFASNAGVTESQYLANAKEFIDKGELKAASIELKNVLQNNPKHPLARLELGKLYLKIGDMVSAEKELSRALSLGITDEQILPYLGRSLLYQGKYAEVMALSHKDLKGMSKS
ncbi:MAG: tetratricopeptide repeat protein, partial [Gammaproteobacteria bacterium]|nr:tetratricopeptide repeat protein [Gammaproteobacteria bacterium]